MIQARNVTITIDRDQKTIVENFSFTVPDGAKTALIGEGGNGKSTLLKWLFDPALVEGYATVTGRSFRPPSARCRSMRTCARTATSARLRRTRSPAR